MAAYGLFELGLSAYDAYTTVQTLSDSTASFGEKTMTGGLFMAGLALPGGGYAQGAKVAENVVQHGLQWSKGYTASSLDNLQWHFNKHRTELKALGINTAQSMYDVSMDLVKRVDNKNVFRFQNITNPSKIDIYDKTKNLLLGIDSRGNISTLHAVTKPGKLKAIKSQIEKILKK